MPLVRSRIFVRCSDANKVSNTWTKDVVTAVVAKATKVRASQAVNSASFDALDACLDNAICEARKAILSFENSCTSLSSFHTDALLKVKSHVEQRNELFDVL